MNVNIIDKAKFISGHITGNSIADLGSEDTNWEENLHKHIEKFVKRIILRVDKYGNPHIIADFNKRFKLKNKADTILAIEVIEHLENPLQFLKNCRDSIKKGGKIIITTPNASGIPEMISSCTMEKIDMIEKKLYEISNNYRKPYPHRHFYSWNKHNFYALISLAGLKVEKFEYISFYWSKNIFFKFISNQITFLKPEMFIVLRKK